MMGAELEKTFGHVDDLNVSNGEGVEDFQRLFQGDERVRGHSGQRGQFAGQQICQQLQIVARGVVRGRGNAFELEQIAALVDLSVRLIQLDLQLQTLAIDLLDETFLHLSVRRKQVEQFLSAQSVVRDQRLVNAFDQAQFDAIFLFLLRFESVERRVDVVNLGGNVRKAEEIADGQANGRDGDVRLADHRDANVTRDDRRLQVVQEERLSADVRRGEQPLTVDVFALRPKVQTQRGQFVARRNQNVRQRHLLTKIDDEITSATAGQTVDAELIQREKLSLQKIRRQLTENLFDRLGEIRRLWVEHVHVGSRFARGVARRGRVGARLRLRTRRRRGVVLRRMDQIGEQRRVFLQHRRLSRGRLVLLGDQFQFLLLQTLFVFEFRGQVRHPGRGNDAARPRMVVVGRGDGKRRDERRGVVVRRADDVRGRGQHVQRLVIRVDVRRWEGEGKGVGRIESGNRRWQRHRRRADRVRRRRMIDRRGVRAERDVRRWWGVARFVRFQHQQVVHVHSFDVRAVARRVHAEVQWRHFEEPGNRLQINVVRRKRVRQQFRQSVLNVRRRVQRFAVDRNDRQAGRAVTRVETRIVRRAVGHRVRSNGLRRSARVRRVVRRIRRWPMA